MPAYLVAGNDVTDPESMQKYAEAVGPTLEGYDVKLIAPAPENLSTGGPVVHKEGDWKPSRVVILEFASMDQLQDWYHSPGYQEIIDLRLNGSEGSLLFVDAD